MIWDLRRGDADDDRLSPGGRGLRSIILSTLFEFNILQGTFALLLLVVLPALLIGLVPSVALTYWAVFNHAIGRFFEEPYLTLAVLAICAGAAYWWGPSLARTTLRNIWQLHYTLVFPIFVLVRESVKLIGERWLREGSSAADLHRFRRRGTLIAGALFAGGSLILAAVLLKTYGIVAVSLTSAPPRDIVRAALIDGFIVLAFSTVVSSLFWAWRELSVVSPVIDWTPGITPQKGRAFRIAHLSDSHIVGGPNDFRMEPGTRGPRGNDRWSEALGRVAALDAQKPFDWILLTGDATDAGTRLEWLEFLDRTALQPQLSARMLILPGNHDVNIADRTDAAKLELPWNISMALRKLRFIVAADRLQGTRAHVVDHASGKLGPSLASFLRSGGREAHMQSLASSGSLRGTIEVSRIWRDLFPLVVPPIDGRPGVILLNSCSDNHMALTNAIGVIDPHQLGALSRLLLEFGAATWLIALHHQVVEYPTPRASLKERVGLSLINAPDLIARIEPHANRILIMHGHRHRDWIGRCGNLALCSTPSAVLGNFDGKYKQGVFHVHDVISGEGGICIASTERISID
jgi:3',5'-cyclic AMP phosphodiesterase CpdA